MLHQELRETPIYNSIIEAVALGSTKLNDISRKSLVEDTSKTSVYLKNLIELGIVEREFSVDVGMKEKAKFYYALFSESGFDDKITAEAVYCMLDFSDWTVCSAPCPYRTFSIPKETLGEEWRSSCSFEKGSGQQ